MYAHLGRLCLAATVLLSTSGCATAGAGSGDEMRSTVFATHRMVQNLDQTLSGTVEQLSDTAADLVARIEASDQDMRRLTSVAQENQYKLEQLQRSLDSLTATLYRHLNLSPPEPIAVQPSPGITPPPLGIDQSDVIVEPPRTPPQLDTAPPPFDTTEPPSTRDEAAHYRRATELYKAEDYPEALRQFEEHLALFPDSKEKVAATYWRAHCHFRMGEYAEAIAGFDELRSSYPSSSWVPTAMHNQAVAYSRLGQNARAEALFQQLIREYPDDVATEGAREKLRQLQRLN